MSLLFSSYKSQHFSTLNELLCFVWSSRDARFRGRKFSWRYLENPLNVKPFVFLAFYGEKAVGMRAFVFQEFGLGKETVNIFNPADTVIHPDYRRKQLFGKLNKELINCIENEKDIQPSFILNLSANQISMPANIKNGWKRANATITYAYSLNLIQLVKGLFKNPNNNLREVISIKSNDIVFEISSQINTAEILSLIKITKNFDRFTNNRSADYFRWRYAEPDKKFYYVYARLNKKLVAVTIFKKNNRNQAVLMEYHSLSADLVKESISVIQRFLRTPIVRTIVLSNHQKRFLKKCGFFIEPVWLLKMFKIMRQPVLVRPSKNVFNDNDFFMFGKDLRDMENWTLFQADVH